MKKHHYEGVVSLEIIAEEYAYQPEKVYRKSLDVLQSFIEKEV